MKQSNEDGFYHFSKNEKVLKFFRKIWIVFFLITSVPFNLYAEDYMRIHFILWGQGNYGDCEFIELPGADGKLGTNDDKCILIDGGRGSTKSSSWVDDFLDNLPWHGDTGVKTIDFMILSCCGADHFTGLSMVVQNYNVLNFFQPVRWPQGDKSAYDTLMNDLNNEGCGPDSLAGHYFEPKAGEYTSGPNANAGPVFNEGDKSWMGFDPVVNAKILAKKKTPPVSGDDDNIWAMVEKIWVGNASFITGGDAYGAQEDAILGTSGVAEYSYTGAAGDLANTDIYKVHHHGSNTNGSSGAAFLAKMNPKFAVPIDGGSSDAHPDINTLNRIINEGAIIYRPDMDGNVLFKCSSGGNYDVIRTCAYPDLPWTGFYNSDTAYSDCAPPGLPENLAIKEIAGDAITIDWDYDASASIAGYYLFYSTYPGGDSGANNGRTNAGMSEETGIYKRHDTLLTSAPFTFSASALGLAQPSYLRLSAVTNYCYERRYSNEVFTTWPPTAITNLTGFCVSGTGGDVRLSWTAPAKYDNEESTDPCKKYFVYYSTDPTLNTDLWNEVDSLSKYGIDFSTIQPKNPGDGETFVIENIPAPGNSSQTYFAVFSQNVDGVFSHISNIATFTVVDVYPPLPVTDLAYALWRDESRIFISWTAPGDDGQEGSAAFCEIIFSNDAAFSAVSTQTIVSPVSAGQKQTYLMTGLDSYERYWIKVRNYDEALNFSVSDPSISCYTGTNFINTPSSFSASVSVSTSPSLEVTFKIEIDTVTDGSPGNSVEIWDMRDNLGNAILTKLTTSQYQVTALTDLRGFSVSPGLEFNHRYKLVISSSLKDIDGETLMSAATYFYFVTLCSPFEKNIFFASDGSSVTVASGQFSSPGSVSFISTLPANLDSSQKAAYDSLAAIYTVAGSAVRGFKVLPGTVTAVIPVSGGIPYIYNSDTLSFEKASSYILNCEVVFEAESPAVWLFVTPASFTANKDPGVYAYPVPATGNNITFTNLGSSAEISVFTISGKCVLRENVTPDPVNGEWVWNFSQVPPGLYFWVVDGTSKGMLMIKR
ncbi:MAG: hypothetical protein CVU78_03875 [Elusimicrobia bacterium HGW-Elusimicrobia-2]|nr:MAG: hypothetical protein CVU78_03875 [Elusimicrobia bacterium HGW-Elusimicrobia-2]